MLNQTAVLLWVRMAVQGVCACMHLSWQMGRCIESALRWRCSSSHSVKRALRSAWGGTHTQTDRGRHARAGRQAGGRTHVYHGLSQPVLDQNQWTMTGYTKLLRMPEYSRYAPNVQRSATAPARTSQPSSSQPLAPGHACVARCAKLAVCAQPASEGVSCPQHSWQCVWHPGGLKLQQSVHAALPYLRQW